jgi:hypothetical protein
MKAKMGRPKLEVTRDVLIGARFTAVEAEQIAAAAAASKRVKSEWIRRALLAAAGSVDGATPVPPPKAPTTFDRPSDDFLD